MPLLDSIETVKEDIAGVLRIGSEQVSLSQKELLLFGILRLILGGIGGTGGDGSVSIDNEALAGAIANALELKTLTVTGDAVNESALANAIAANTQPISVSSLPLPTDAATETTLSNLSAKLPSALVSGRLSVDGSAVTQPISVATLPLPSGAATESTLSGLSAKLPSALVSGRLSVDGSAVTQPISAASLPLPTGAATESTLSSLSAKLPSALVSGRLSVDGSAVTQPVSATSLPLPTGAATQTTLAALLTELAKKTNTTDISSVNLNKYGNNSTVSFSANTISGSFTLTDKYLIAIIPAISGTPSLTLQVSLDGTNYTDTSVSITASATNSVVIESDMFNRVIACIGLTNALRFKSSTSITATISLRNSHG